MNEAQKQISFSLDSFGQEDYSWNFCKQARKSPKKYLQCGLASLPPFLTKIVPTMMYTLAMQDIASSLLTNFPRDMQCQLLLTWEISYKAVNDKTGFSSSSVIVCLIVSFCLNFLVPIKGTLGEISRRFSKEANEKLILTFNDTKSHIPQILK